MDIDKKALFAGLGASFVCLLLALGISAALSVFFGLFAIFFASHFIAVLVSVPILGSVLLALPMAAIFFLLNRTCLLFSATIDYRRGLKWGLLFSFVFIISGSRLQATFSHIAPVLQSGSSIGGLILNDDLETRVELSYVAPILKLLPSLSDMAGLGYTDIIQSGDFSSASPNLNQDSFNGEYFNYNPDFYHSFAQRDFHYRGGFVTVFIRSDRVAGDGNIDFLTSYDNLSKKHKTPGYVFENPNGPNLMGTPLKTEDVIGPIIGEKSFYLKYFSDSDVASRARFRLEFLKNNMNISIYMDDPHASAQKLYEIGSFIQNKIEALLPAS